jgi:predicted dienelactone hydrolase
MSVGCQRIDAWAEGTGEAVPAVVLYPTDAPARPEGLGPFTLDVAAGAPARPGAHPLVLVSHGSGGAPLTHRVLAHDLAARGFVVGLVEHPGNNRTDNRLAGTVENLARRPRHLRAAADWFFGDGPFAGSVEPGSYAVIGHSLGATTALALAGGEPTSLPEESPHGRPRPVPVAPDPRLRALVLLAPATPWFRLPGALAGVRLPILMRSGERDQIAPPGYMTPIVLGGLPAETPIDHRVVPNAGHYSFLSPWPPALRSPALPPSQDPPGFDREAFMAELGDEVAAFLARRGARGRPDLPDDGRDSATGSE